MILNIHQLRSFYHAANHKSISKAARELMVTPPAITMQIKQLEENLGLRLVYRDGHAIELTDIGDSVFQKAENIFRDIKKLENYLEDTLKSRSGELHIGCPQTASKFIMPRLISHFREAYPGIRIVLDQGNHSALVKKIMNQEVDLAFVLYRPEEKRFKVKILGRTDAILLAANNSKHLPGDEISVTQLAELPLIVPEAGSGLRDVVFEYLRRHKVTPNLALESGSIAFIKELLRGDSGIAFLESYSVQEELERRVLKPIRILEGSPSLRLGIGYFQRKDLSPTAWAFLRILDKLDDILPLYKRKPRPAIKK
jgi:DNA-binding transcriptional LysR family regulator